MLSIISCDCENKDRNQPANSDRTVPLPHPTLGTLDMKVLPDKLLGDNKVTSAIFSLEGAGKVLLKDSCYAVDMVACNIFNSAKAAWLALRINLYFNAK